MIKMVAIDDMPEIGVILNSGLSSLVDFIFFSDPLKAKDYLCAHQWDLVLTDINMQGLSGIELLDTIGKDKDVWAMTYFEDSITNEKLKNIGFQVIVKKPLDIFCLQKLIIGKFSLKKHNLVSNINYQQDIDKYKIRYIESKYEELTRLKQEIEKEDLDKIGHFCHNIKGLAPMFDVPSLIIFAEHLHLITKKKELHYYKSELLQDLELLANDLRAMTL